MLENILWSEVGTKNEYEEEYGKKPLGELVREIVGIDMKAAKEAFSEYLNNVNLDSRQIYFLKQIIEYSSQRSNERSFGSPVTAVYRLRKRCRSLYRYDAVAWYTRSH